MIFLCPPEISKPLPRALNEVLLLCRVQKSICICSSLNISYRSRLRIGKQYNKVFHFFLSEGQIVMKLHHFLCKKYIEEMSSYTPSNPYPISSNHITRSTLFNSHLLRFLSPLCISQPDDDFMGHFQSQIWTPSTHLFEPTCF